MDSSSKYKAQTTTWPNVTINNHRLEVLDEFTYLRSIISIKLYLDKEIDDEFVWQPLLSLALENVCGKNHDSLSKQNFQCITLVFLVHFNTEANPRQHMLLMSVY